MRRVGSRARCIAHAMVGGALLFASAVQAQTLPAPNLFDVYNDYGDIGLLQTPTARMADDGEFGGGLQEVYPYAQIHLALQPLPWLETAVRYTEVLDVPFSAGSSSTTPSHFKDRSLDFKVHLVEESAFLPALALGVQDFGGTGLFQGEYLVVDRRVWDFDFSLGMGWGRLGQRGTFANPLRLFGHHFGNGRAAAEPGASGTPGGLGITRLFTGQDVGLFGGVRWRTPLRGLFLDLEYDGNNYHNEAFHDAVPQQRISTALPVNMGLTYRLGHQLELGIGYERGNKLMARIMVHTNFEHETGPPKVLDPPAPPVFERPATIPNPPGVPLAPPGPAVPTSGRVREPLVTAATDDDTIVRKLSLALARQGFTLVAASLHDPGYTVTVWLEQNTYRNAARVVGRTARVLTELAPPSAEFFRVVELHQGMELYRVTVQRHELEKAAEGDSSPEEVLVTSKLEGGQGMPSHPQFNSLSQFPKFSYDIVPSYRQNIGSPNGFYFYQFWLDISGRLRLTQNWDVESSVGINLYNNFNSLSVRSDSVLPHVRSDIDQYLKQGKNDLVSLETNYFWSPAPRLFTRVSAGIFEEMYGGVSAEMLYRPFARRWAVGVDVAELRQRTFRQRFAFQHYQTTTAFLDLYYEWPYHDVLSQITIGRYLARDYGATLSVARRFRSGVVAGAFVTKTNVSAATFGEGSFDKGIFISVPLDIGLPLSTQRTANVLFRPLQRDGGQRAVDGPELFSITSGSALGDVYRGWPEVLH